MTMDELKRRDIEAWVWVLALERQWRTPRDEVLARALHECAGVHSALNTTLKGSVKLSS